MSFLLWCEQAASRLKPVRRSSWWNQMKDGGTRQETVSTVTPPVVAVATAPPDLGELAYPWLLGHQQEEVQEERSWRSPQVDSHSSTCPDSTVSMETCRCLSVSPLPLHLPHTHLHTPPTPTPPHLPLQRGFFPSQPEEASSFCTNIWLLPEEPSQMLDWTSTQHTINPIAPTGRSCGGRVSSSPPT